MYILWNIRVYSRFICETDQSKIPVIQSLLSSFLCIFRSFLVLFPAYQTLHFSSAEPKVQVTSSDHLLSAVRPSVCKLFTFLTSSLEPLHGPNLTKLSTSSLCKGDS